MKKKKKKPPYKLKACRSKKCGSLLISWETMIGHTFETIRQAA